MLAGAGDTYWVDSGNCLHLKITDPGNPWQYTNSFQRDGLYVEEEVRHTASQCVVGDWAAACSGTVRSSQLGHLRSAFRHSRS